MLELFVGQYDPAVHTDNASLDERPVTGQYLPPGHGVAALKPVALQNEPNVQAVGALIPVEAQNEPVVHGIGAELP